MKRQKFIQITAGTGAAVSAAFFGRMMIPRQSLIVKPLSKECSPSFFALSQRARFGSAKEAMKIAGRFGNAFVIQCQHDKADKDPVDLRIPATKISPSATQGLNQIISMKIERNHSRIGHRSRLVNLSLSHNSIG